MKFSIIIALAPERKIKVLDSLKELDYPKSKYEIIVEEGLNPSINRNNGASKAKYDILAFVDDDALVDKNWLKNASKMFKENDVSVMGGPQLTPEDDGFFAKTSGMVIESFFGTAGMSKRYKKSKLNFNADEFSLTSANCFIKKDIFEEVGGFNPKLFPGEDPELFARIKRGGYKIVYDPEIFVYHKRRPDFGSLCKQFFLYGVSRIKKEKMLKSVPSPLFAIPTLLLIYILISPFLILNSIWFSLPLVIYLGIGLVYGFLFSIKKRDIRLIILIPFLYLSLHLSYGLGIIRGLV